MIRTTVRDARPRYIEMAPPGGNSKLKARAPAPHSMFLLPTKLKLGAVVALVVGTGGLVTPDYVVARNARGYPLHDFQYGTNLTPQTGNTRKRYRNAVQNLARIRDVFKPSITELALLFGVSRQAIYNWQSGQPIAEQNEARLDQVALAADLLSANGLTGSTRQLRRKLPGGKTLFEAIQAGESAELGAVKLISMLKEESSEREQLASLRPSKLMRIDISDVGSPYVAESRIRS